MGAFHPGGGEVEGINRCFQQGGSCSPCYCKPSCRAPFEKKLPAGYGQYPVSHQGPPGEPKKPPPGALFSTAGAVLSAVLSQVLQQEAPKHRLRARVCGCRQSRCFSWLL